MAWRRTLQTVSLGLVMAARAAAPALAQDGQTTYPTDRRVAVGFEAAAVASPRDDIAFFNYTDYEHNALRVVRLRLMAEWRAASALSFVGEVRTEVVDRRRRVGALPPVAAVDGPRRRRPGRARTDPDWRVSPARVRPCERRHRMAAGVSIPRLAAAGCAARDGGRSSADARPRLAAVVSHRFAGAPAGRLADQRVALGHRRADQRGRCGGSHSPARSLKGRRRVPSVRDRTPGLGWSGRASFVLPAGVVIGASGGTGNWIHRQVLDQASLEGAAATQSVVGVDAEAGRGHWLLRTEWFHSAFTLPIAAATPLQPRHQRGVRRRPVPIRRPVAGRGPCGAASLRSR